MHNQFEHREFMIFNISELSNVDFSQVLETSEQTVRKSVDGNKTFVKWDGDVVPTSVQNLITKEGPYTYDEMTNILSTDEWKKPII